MPVPSSITDLSETISANSPAGSETVGPQANDYLQALSAFIRQIYDGQLQPAADVSLNSHKLINVLPGTVSATSTDAVTGAQLFAIRGVLGEIRMWSGTATQAAVTAAWGAGWHLADGTLGTFNLRDRFIVGAGNLYGVNTSGGTASNVLSIPNLPSHNHGTVDTGHSHGITDAGHSHAISDPGHNHILHGANTTGGGALTYNGLSTAVTTGTDNSATGITIQSASSNTSVNSAATGITVGFTGNGTPVNNLPPYFALCFVQYTGA